VQVVPEAANQGSGWPSERETRSKQTRSWYCVHCHKWLCAPKGSAFLFTRREAQPLLQPLVVSWGWESDKPGPSRFVDEQERQGTRDPAAYLSVPAAIQFQAEHDWPRVRAQCHELLCEARRRIEELGRSMLRPYECRNPVSARSRVSMLCSDSPQWYAHMAAFPLPPHSNGGCTRSTG
jgi:selenocysteine lyase/cysteine desulfurase